MEESVLTKSQRKLLGLISKNNFITKNFFLTGGTALSEFYFKHRFSEDLDLFSENEFNSKEVLSSISSFKKALKPIKIEQQSLTGQEIFFFHFSDKDIVKIDFAYFPFTPLGNFTKLNQLNISGVEDICINKVHAISTRKRARDYLDLYFCIEHLKWSAVDIRNNYKLKFDVSLSYEQLIASFINVVDAKDLPIFLGKTSWSDVKNYFLKQAENLKKEIIQDRTT